MADNSNNKTMCPVPFTSLIFNPDGKIGCCRERGNKDVIAQMKKGISFDEIWNGEEIRKWRREFIDGTALRCQEFIKNEKCHLSGLNQQLALRCDYQEYQKTPPILISPDFNGQCNLQCVMCDVWELPNGLYDSQWDYWKVLEKDVLPFVKIIDPLGGEPFIQKDTYRLMQLMNKVNKAAQWRFTTNGQWRFSKYISKNLDQLDILSFQYSVDAVTEKSYQHVRKGGTLKKLQANIEQHISYREGRVNTLGKKALYPFKSITVVMDNNWREIPAIITMMTNYGIEPLFVKCKSPDTRRIDLLPPDNIMEVLDYIFTNVSEFRYVFRLVNWLIEALPSDRRMKYKKQLLLNCS